MQEAQIMGKWFEGLILYLYFVLVLLVFSLWNNWFHFCQLTLKFQSACSLLSASDPLNSSDSVKDVSASTSHEPISRRGICHQGDQMLAPNGSKIDDRLFFGSNFNPEVAIEGTGLFLELILRSPSVLSFMSSHNPKMESLFYVYNSEIIDLIRCADFV